MTPASVEAWRGVVAGSGGDEGYQTTEDGEEATNGLADSSMDGEGLPFLAMGRRAQ